MYYKDTLYKTVEYKLLHKIRYTFDIWTLYLPLCIVFCTVVAIFKFENLSKNMDGSVDLCRYALFWNKFLFCSCKYILDCNYL